MFVLSYGAWQLLRVTMGIRVSPEEEIEGLHIGEHGMSAYPEFVSVSEPHIEIPAPKPPSAPKIKLKPKTKVVLE